MIYPQNPNNVRSYAEQLYEAISLHDEKTFEEIIEYVEEVHDLDFLKRIINFNSMDIRYDQFTAIQAATIHALQYKELRYLSRLIQLGGNITWQTQTTPFDAAYVNSEKIQENYVYQGPGIGDSIYESFERQDLESYLSRAQIEILDETLSSIKTLLLLPRDIISIINQYMNLQIQIIFSLSDNQPRTWLSDFPDQEIFYAYRNVYNQQNPDAEKNGYGSGALVVYQPKPIAF